MNDADIDLLVMLANPVSKPDRAAHALRLLGVALAMGDVAALYLVAGGVTLLGPDVPHELRDTMDMLRELELAVYACPTALADHALTPDRDSFQVLGAAAAVELAHHARLVMSL